MKFFCLASGSSGNCYYVEEGNTKVLIDAGLSFKQTNLRLDANGIDIDDLNALLLSHEHIDHMRSADMMNRKLDINVHSNKKTIEPYNTDGRFKSKTFQTNQKFECGDFKVKAIQVSHDCAEPVGFVIQSNGTKLGIITDTGFATDEVKKAIKDVDNLVIEANHDSDMLMNGRYPIFLKRRILSNNGHLSNEQAGVLLLEHASDKLKNVFLAHLSENNNSPEIAYNTISSIVHERKDLKKVKFHLTDRYKPTKIIKI